MYNLDSRLSSIYIYIYIWMILQLPGLNHDEVESIKSSVVHCHLKLSNKTSASSPENSLTPVSHLLMIVKDAGRAACFQFMRAADLCICEDYVRLLLHSTKTGNPDIMSRQKFPITCLSFSFNFVYVIVTYFRVLSPLIFYNI